jgi:hypothetical protein
MEQNIPEKQEKPETSENTPDIPSSSIEQCCDISAEISVHPVIVALEKTGESAVVIDGFLGTGTDSVIRLYQSLDTSAYLEISKGAIIHMEVDKFEPNAIRVFVRASSEILSVWRERVRAGDYRQGPRPPDLPPLQPNPTFWTCAASCESVFASRATAILIDETSCLTRPTDQLRQEACLFRIAQRKHVAKTALYTCLERCLATYGRPLTVGTPFSLGEYYSTIVARHLELPE